MRSNETAPSGQAGSDPSDTAELAFTARRSAAEPCLDWRLSADSLFCTRESMPTSWLSWLGSADDWPGRIPLDEIAAIRLRFDPTRFASDRYRCDLRARDGARISIFSTHYLGPGNFEDRAEDYAAFIAALTRRAQRRNPALKLTGGLSWPGYLLQHGLLLAALILLVTMLGIAGVPFLGSGWVKLAIIATYAGVAMRYARINIPKDFSLPARKT